MTISFADFFWLSFIALVVIMATFAAVAASYKLFRRSDVRIVFFLVLFCCGVVLYYETDMTPPYRGTKTEEVSGTEKFINAMNSSLSIFFPSRGEYDDIWRMVRRNGQTDHSRLLMFLILHYLAYCYFAAIVFSFFGARTADRLWTKLYFSAMPDIARLPGLRWLNWQKRLKHVYVFWGVSEESETLADSLAKDKSLRGRCLFVVSRELWHEKERYAAVADRLAARGHRVVWEDLDANGNWYESAGRHFFLGSDEKENAKLAAMLVGAAVRRGVMTLDVYVRGRTPKEIDGINIHHIDSADNAARLLLNEHPIQSCQGVTVDAGTFAVKGKCRTLIVGFGEIGQAVLKQHLMRNSFPGLALKTDVVGGDKEELETFKMLHPGLFANGTAGELALHPIKPSSADFLKWIGERGGDFDRIVICPENGIDCIVLGERIARIIGGAASDCEAEIFAYDACNESTKRKAKVKTFGKTRDLFTRELVVDGLRIQHLPAAMMAEMANQETAAWRKTFCHNATDRMLDLIRIAGFKPAKRTSCEAAQRAADELAAAVESGSEAIAASFGAARRAFMAWKGLPADKYAETDAQFAKDFLKIFNLAETTVGKQD